MMEEGESKIKQFCCGMEPRKSSIGQILARFRTNEWQSNGIIKVESVGFELREEKEELKHNN